MLKGWKMGGAYVNSTFIGIVGAEDVVGRAVVADAGSWRGWASFGGTEDTEGREDVAVAMVRDDSRWQ